MFLFRCDKYPDTIGFPSKRSPQSNNFIGAIVASYHWQMWEKCPENCGRVDHHDWEYC